MFGITWYTLLALLLWTMLAIAAFKSSAQMTSRLRLRLITLLGAVLTICGFFFQPWLYLDFMRYLDLGPDLIADILPEAIQRLAPESLAKVWRLVEEFSQLKAWQLQMIPFYRLGTRLAVILPTLLALLALFWLPFGVVMGGRRISKAIGAVLCGLSLWALIILLGALPELDALGASTQREWSFVVVLLGVRLGNGVWFTVVGLLLLVAGGIVEIVTPGPRRPLPQPLRGIW